MKNRNVTTGLLAILILAGAALPGRGQGDAKTAVPENLTQAAEAVKAGSESRAWNLLTQDPAAFDKYWASLDGSFLMWVADQYREQKRFADCQALLDRAAAKAGLLKPADSAQAQLIKGDMFRDQLNFAAARLEYLGLDRNTDLRGTPAGLQARFRLVEILRITKDYDAAEQALEKLRDAPDAATQAEAYYQAARLAFDRESFAETRSLIEEVKKRVPEHVEALFLEAELNLREDRLQDPDLEIGSRVMMTYVVPGRPITMKMQDRNLAVVRGGAGIPVEVQTSKGKDRELVTLLPSPRDPTLFRGTIPTRLGEAAPTNAGVEVTGADVLTYGMEASFQKASELQYPPKSMMVAFDAELAASSGEILSAAEQDELALRKRLAAAAEDEKQLRAFERQRDTSVIRPGNDIRLQVIDYDRDLGPELDTVFVSAKSSSGDTVEGVELKETEAHSGVFKGTLPTASAPPKAAASDSAEGKNPGAAISRKENGVWTSLADGAKPKWFEVDLMGIQPLAEATLDFCEPGSVKAASLLAVADGKTECIASTRPAPEQVYGFLDLAKHFGPVERTAAYVYTEVTSATDLPAVFKIGSSEGVVCWLNGERVHNNQGGRLWKPEEDVVKVTLKQGVNAVLMRVSRLKGPWGASLTVLDEAGKPLPSMKAKPPAAPGVVTQWHVFDRPTPEDIQVARRINVSRPIVIQGKAFRWVAKDVSPAASLTIEGTVLRAAFHRPEGLRTLRWVFDETAGPAVSAKAVSVKNRFGEAVIPSEIEYSTARGNRVLELAPGDKIEISYRDERRIRNEETLAAAMKSGFHNAEISMEYETIGADAQGERTIEYDPALRYRAGQTDHLAVRVVDYDADTTSEPDKVKILVENSEGEQLWLEGVETEPHSGAFVAILKLGAAAGADTIRVGPRIGLTASYQDRENGDGQLDRTTSVAEAGTEPPEMLLYQTLLSYDRTKDEKTGLSKGLTVETKLVEGEAAKAPVVTSIDTSVLFGVVYPAAALSQGATYKARVVTERERKAAEQEKREPAGADVTLKLTDGEAAEFQGSVGLRTGDPRAYVEVESVETADGKAVKPAVLYVRGDDVLHVLVNDLAGKPAGEGVYRLASDADLAFRDRKYEKDVEQLYLGDYLYLWLSDRDLDVSDELDPATVKLGGKAETRTLTLTETLPHSGRFTGRVRTAPAGGAAAGSDTGGVLRVQFGETLQATVEDKNCVSQAAGRTVTRSIAVFPGADGGVAPFTKRFADEDIAVKTRLLTAEALFELAKEHRETNQKPLAEQELAEGKTTLEEAIADYPDTKHAPHAEFLLANLAQELEKYDEALERYNRVLSTWPDSEFAPKAQLRKGICLEKMQDYDNALDAYVELTYSYPKSPLVSDAIVRLGQHFYRTSQYEVAGRVFGNFHDRNPEHELASKTLFLSGQSYMKGAEERRKTNQGVADAKVQEWLGEAVRQFSRLVRSSADKDLRPEGMYWLADCYLKRSDMKSAYITLKTLTFDYPESKWAKFARGQLVQNAEAFQRIEEE